MARQIFLRVPAKEIFALLIIFFGVSAKIWSHIAESVGTSGRQPWSRFISTIHGLASLLLLLLFSLYSLHAIHFSHFFIINFSNGKISFYIKSIKDIKYMFRLPYLATPNVFFKILNILGRQTLWTFFLNSSRSKPQNTACQWH